MTLDKDLTPEQREARDKVQSLLNELRQLIGPAGMWTSEDYDDIGEPPDDVFLTEWVIVMNWISVDDGDATITQVSSENMLMHHRRGLLDCALNDLD